MSEQDNIEINIDGKSFHVNKNSTLMDAIENAGIHTPIICYHEATTSEGLCRLCVVEVEGWRTLAPACITKVSPGMEIKTKSERVNRSRRTILEMLDASVDLSESPEIQEYMHEFSADPDRFPDAQNRHFEPLDDNPFYIRDYSKCLMCWRCVQACGDDLQFTYSLSVGGRGFDSKISTFFESPMPETTCVFCGNCVAVCPTNALIGKTEYFLEQGLDYDEIRQKRRAEKRSKEVK
ncbi:MAG: 2Fe-2S iron-sulfur cluster binding domain-containing protein [Aliifodinibius sp.]|nr:2Fe-2S iron-sulfur cluster binding domain-containing protein [Fodinibius sp.]